MGSVDSLEPWAAYELWTLREAAYLLSGLPPRSEAEFRADMNGKGPVAKAYRALKDATVAESLAFKDFGGLVMRRRVRPSDVVAWAVERGMTVPAMLMSARVAAAAWVGSMTRSTDHELPMFARLHPVTQWTGTALVDTDQLELADAAKRASAHAGVELTAEDFLRAAAHGKILLRAICRRHAVMASTCGDEPLVVPKGSIPTLPQSACLHLANVGEAEWRTVDGFEPAPEFDNRMCRYTKWKLPDAEPGIVTRPDDCRVSGYDVHAVADDAKARRLAQETQPPSAEPVPGVFATAKASKTTQAAERVARQDARLAACEAQGMAFDKASLLRVPDGIGAVAKTLGIERQSLTIEVKAALKRRFEAARNGKG